MKKTGAIAALSAIFAFLAPIQSLIITACIFIGIDFATGVWASYVRARRAKKQWVFSSSRMWHTITKTVFIAVGIVMCYLLCRDVLGESINIPLPKIFTGFCCAVELYSFLENAAEISNHPIFKWLKRFMANKLDDAGIDISEATQAMDADKKAEKKEEKKGAE